MTQASGLSFRTRMCPTYSLSFVRVAFPVYVLLAAHFLLAQTTEIPAAKKDAKVEILPLDEAIKAQGPKPLTPTDRLPAALLPEKPGCYHLVDGAWKAAHCGTDEEKKAHHFPVPSPADSIQSTRHSISLPNGGEHIYSYVPFVRGSVAFSQESNPVQATEADSSAGAANAFSIQANTNTFPCTTCEAGYPFPQNGQLANSASKAGDQGWVQFAYQQFKAGAIGVGSSQLCIWNIDNNIASTAGKTILGQILLAGYNSTCVYPSDVDSVTPLDGAGAPTGSAEVVGYIQCPAKSSPPGSCTLWELAYLPWSPGSGWWSVSAPDLMGLAGQWTNLSGGVLGAGNGSQAVFTNTKIQEVLHAYSCEGSPKPVQSSGAACPAPTAAHPASPLLKISASPASYDPTDESNNLTPGQASFKCGTYDCWLTIDSSAQ